MWSVLRGVAMTSGVLPSDSLGLKTALLTGRVEPTVPASRGTGGVGVGQRFFTETPLKHRPTHKRTKKNTLESHDGSTAFYFKLSATKTAGGTNT